MTTPREDAIAALRAAGEDVRGFARHAETCAYRPTYPESPVATCTCGFDAVADAWDLALGTEAETPNPWVDAMADPTFRASLDEGRADVRAGRVAALGAEAETPDRMSPTVGGKYPEPLPATPHPQRRWHRCEYPGCGLWHDSRDEVTP